MAGESSTSCWAHCVDEGSLFGTASTASQFSSSWASCWTGRVAACATRRSVAGAYGRQSAAS
eukprot:7231948-Pyramimonas_sp.AAC.1